MTIDVNELQREASKFERLHAVVLPYPAKGHSIPFLHFAKRLQSMGMVVTFVNTYDHLSDEHFRTLGGPVDSTIRVVSLGVPPETEGNVCLPHLECVNELVREAEVLVENLFDQDGDAPPACIISDMFLGWTQDVANKFEIPWYVLFASPASALATFLHRPQLLKQGRLPIDRSKREELVCDIPGVPPTRLADLPSPMQNPNDYFYEFYARNSEQMQKATGVLVNTFYEMEPSCIDAIRRTTYGALNDHEIGHKMSVLPIGPLLPAAYFTDSDEPEQSAQGAVRDPCLQWLDTQPERSVLYVSFGSVAVLSFTQVHELALGLEASGARFLLVLRPPSGARNGSLLPEGFLERTKDRGFVHVAWAPQLQVLSHRAVGGFLTHCGWNSTLESICRGVAMVAWPIQAEQAMNARFIVDDVEAAVEMCKVTDELVPKERVEEVVRLFMTEGTEGTKVRHSVRKLQRQAMEAVQEGGSVEQNLRDFVAALRVGKHAETYERESVCLN